MNWPIWAGIVVFVGLPTLLWLFGLITLKPRSLDSGLFALAAGSDNRLSLSKLQAFAWTLVIFGSFAAAMTIHTKIIPGSPGEIKKAEDEAKTASESLAALKAKVTTSSAEAKAAADAKTAADKVASEAEAQAAALAADATPEAKKAVQDKLTQAKADAQLKAARNSAAQTAANNAREELKQAETTASTAAEKVKSYNWVEIPTALLALAGIAVGSGVFSSLISALNSEDKTAEVQKIEVVDSANLAARFPTALVPKNPHCLFLEGINLGKTGKVQLDKKVVPILLWKEDGTGIVVDVADDQTFKTLVVETPNGKLSYWLDGTTPTLTIGHTKHYYELSDLFRDDKNPNNFDLMKFQMFGWTVIAISIYCYLFLNNLNHDIESLPVVPQSIVILTGLSQSGYLTGKAVSNMGANK